MEVFKSSFFSIIQFPPKYEDSFCKQKFLLLNQSPIPIIYAEKSIMFSLNERFFQELLFDHAKNCMRQT